MRLFTCCLAVATWNRESQLAWSSFGVSAAAFVAVGARPRTRGPPRHRVAAATVALPLGLSEPLKPSGRMRRSVTGEVARWVIRRKILSKIVDATNLDVAVRARGNRAAALGCLDSLCVTADSIVTDDLSVSGGAEVEVLGLDCSLPGPLRRLRRLRRPAEVRLKFELEGSDVAHSSAVRRLVQLVLNAAVARGSGEKPVKVRRVYLRHGKVGCEGELAAVGLVTVPFLYLTRLRTSPCGHVLSLYDSEVYQTGGPKVLGARVSVPLPLPLGVFDIDLGDEAQIQSLSVSQGRLSLQGRFLLSPAVQKRAVAERRKRDGDDGRSARRKASFRHDLGETLSALICPRIGLRRN